MKSRTHTFIMKVTFDKACTRSVALREVRDDGGIDAGGFQRKAGEHYCTAYEGSEPETFKVRSVKLQKVQR